jgi:hypothetical protein
MDKSGKKAGSKSMAAGSAATKRIATTKKSAPAKKPAAKKVSAAKKPAPAKKPVGAPVVAKAAAPKPTPAATAPRPAAVAPRPAQPAVSARPAVAAVARPAGSNAALDERRKAATRKFFARLRSLEAIVGADLRKRGSVVLMQAVDQWYNEAISATATDVTITNAAKTVITHL